MSKPNKEDLLTIFDENADHKNWQALESIYSLFIESGNREKVTFHYVLQRIMILLQDRLAFSIFEEVQSRTDKKRYKVRYIFNNDPLASQRIANTYDAFFSLKTNNKQHYLLRIFDSKFYLFCFRITHLDHNNPERFQFIPIGSRRKLKDNDKIIRSGLKNFFSKHKKHIDPHFPNFSTYIEQSIKNLPDINVDSNPPNLDDIYQQKSKKFIGSKTEFDKNKEKFESLFYGDDSSLIKKRAFSQSALDKSYSKIRKNLIALSDTDPQHAWIEFKLPQLPNFLFFVVRAQHKNEKPRKGVYDFGLRIGMGKEQQIEIKKYFKALTDISKEEFQSKYFIFSESVEKLEEAHTLANLLDDYFWKQLTTISTSEKFIDSIMEILNADFGPNLRSVIDPLFYNRYIHYPYPFEKTGLNRVVDNFSIIHSISDLEASNLLSDCLRVVITYYLFLGMSSEQYRNAVFRRREDNQELLYAENIAIMAIPVEVQGTVFGCICHFAYLGMDNSNGKIYGRLWFQNYLLYHSIDTRFRRRIRRDMEDMYLDHIEDTFISNLVILFERDDKKEKLIRLLTFKNIEKIINKNINQMLPFFPFPKLTIKPISILETDEKYDIELIPDYLGLRINFSSNKYFRPISIDDKKQHPRYLKKDSVLYRMDGAINKVISHLISE